MVNAERELTMKSHFRISRTYLIALAAMLLPAAAQAQEETDPPASGLDISATATVTSNYVFRGVSLSDNDPAVQGSIEVEHSSGLYAGTWASSIARYAGTNAELDLYAGWRPQMGAIDLDLGVVAYLYPGGKGGNYSELAGSAGYTIGPVELRAGAAWAPSQKNIGHDDNLYLFTSASTGVPGTPVTLTADLGRERGSLAGPTGRKWDWGLGAEWVRERLTLGVAYRDSSIKRSDDPDRLAKGRVTGSVSLSF